MMLDIRPLLAVPAVLIVVACGGTTPSSPSTTPVPSVTTTPPTTVTPIAVPCGDVPPVDGRRDPVFSRPFEGDFRLTNYFDHDLPMQFQDTNGYQLNACAERITGRVDGHSGYDWLLPLGTPLLSTVDGTVTFAGTDPPFSCPPLGRTVSDQLVVSIRYESGVRYDSQYLHLSRLDVTSGQRVTQGQVIGLSGSTGCNTQPHLHFQVRAVGGQNSGALIDPYGWMSSDRDPWELHPQGKASVWLWRSGEAPRLRTQ